ncbi:methyltransferase [Actinomycetota bacterium Odt1-20B]
MTAPEEVSLPSPDRLMALSTGFWAFKALATAHELDVFARVDAAGGITAAGLAADLGVETRPTRLLLTACAALDLLESDDGVTYRNTPLADAYLVPGRPYHFGGWLRMLDQRLYAGWGRLTEAVRSNAPTTWDPARQKSLFDNESPELLDSFWEGMHSLSSSTARVLARSADFTPYRNLLDLGGGSGAYSIELCRAHPELRATVLDLPHVCPVADAHAAQAGLSDRVTTRPGDFLGDEPLPQGHDLMLLSMILHDWDADTGRALLSRCRSALAPGGAVVISELMVDDRRDGPPAAALMGLNMLVETVGGENYTAGEYGEWLVEAGFRPPRRIDLDAPGANAALIAVVAD